MNDTLKAECVCGHSRSSHMCTLEKERESGQDLTVRAACLVRWCDCPRYDAKKEKE